MNLLSCRPCTILLAALLCSAPALPQSLVSSESLPSNLPEAPVPQTGTPESPQGLAQVKGTLQDTEGNPVPEATVTLSAPGKLAVHTAVTQQDGTFIFSGLTPGQYRLIIAPSGLDPYTSPEFPVRAGATVALPAIALRISTTTSVNVVATDEQVAVAEVHLQEQQRVFGVFPNFYTSYIWTAQPMPVAQKYKLAGRALIDPFSFVIVGALAGAEQYNGTYPGYGPGIEGYGKRFGAALADATTARIVGSAVLPALFHQDPRYFYQGSGGAASRTLHALASTFITRGDNGRNQPNYSHLLGSLVAGAVSNAYHPESSRGVTQTFQTFGITVAGNLGGNLIREFILRSLEPAVPLFANGKKTSTTDKSAP